MSGVNPGSCYVAVKILKFLSFSPSKSLRFSWASASIMIHIIYLQLLYREVQGILLYQGFHRQIWLTKHPKFLTLIIYF